MSTSANHLDEVNCANDKSGTLCLTLYATTSYPEGARFITAGNISQLCITVDSGFYDERMNNALIGNNSEYMNCAANDDMPTEIDDSWHLVLLLRRTMRPSMTNVT